MHPHKFVSPPPSLHFLFYFLLLPYIVFFYIFLLPPFLYVFLAVLEVHSSVPKTSRFLLFFLIVPCAGVNPTARKAHREFGLTVAGLEAWGFGDKAITESCLGLSF